MKKITALILALMLVLAIVLSLTSCGKPEEVKAAEPTTEVVTADTANYAEVKKVAERLVKEPNFLVLSSSDDGTTVMFDTRSGVEYCQVKTWGITGPTTVVLYQNDGKTPLNVYHENNVWTDAEKIEYLLNTQWDTLVNYA